jgi:hypothetical protein
MSPEVDNGGLNTIQVHRKHHNCNISFGTLTVGTKRSRTNHTNLKKDDAPEVYKGGLNSIQVKCERHPFLKTTL